MGLFTLAKETDEASEMSEFARWLLQASDRIGLSVSRIAERAGMSRSYLHKLMNSHKPEYRYYRSPRYEKTLAIGSVVGDVPGAMQAAGRQKEYQERTGKQQATSAVISGHVIEAIKGLFNGMDDPLSRIGRDVDTSQFSRLPLATGRASAGAEVLTAETEETEQLGDVIRGDVRTICVDGDCMEPFFRNGDILFVQRSDTAENGQTVVAVFNGESVACKVYRNTNEGEFLEATNGKYPRISGDFRIVGIVKGSYRP